jgi:hypothetical protein
VRWRKLVQNIVVVCGGYGTLSTLSALSALWAKSLSNSAMRMIHSAALGLGDEAFEFSLTDDFESRNS